MKYKRDNYIPIILTASLSADDVYHSTSGGATPGCARSNDLTGRSTALAQALALPCLALRMALLPY